ncbi:hypothetical protein [Acaryochloris sp. 'Moss Beach']|uniref:hypothetical protein n=1 Tax=Acaryochloris sp. 'Moss Beach' TaxID=2740837 RepID=UPI001F46061A
MVEFGSVWHFQEQIKGGFLVGGGRTIQAMRTVLEMAGKAANQTVYLEVFNEGGADKQPSRPKKPPQKRRR